MLVKTTLSIDSQLSFAHVSENGFQEYLLSSFPRNRNLGDLFPFTLFSDLRLFTLAPKKVSTTSDLFQSKKFLISISWFLILLSTGKHIH